MKLWKSGSTATGRTWIAVGTAVGDVVKSDVRMTNPDGHSVTLELPVR
jgi:hypothetical protein